MRNTKVKLVSVAVLMAISMGVSSSVDTKSLSTLTIENTRSLSSSMNTLSSFSRGSITVNENASDTNSHVTDVSLSGGKKADSLKESNRVGLTSNGLMLDVSKKPNLSSSSKGIDSEGLALSIEGSTGFNGSVIAEGVSKDISDYEEGLKPLVSERDPRMDVDYSDHSRPVYQPANPNDHSGKDKTSHSNFQTFGVDPGDWYLPSSREIRKNPTNRFITKDPAYYGPLSWIDDDGVTLYAIQTSKGWVAIEKTPPKGYEAYQYPLDYNAIRQDVINYAYSKNWGIVLDEEYCAYQDLIDAGDAPGNTDGYARGSSGYSNWINIEQHRDYAAYAGRDVAYDYNGAGFGNPDSNALYDYYGLHDECLSTVDSLVSLFSEFDSTSGDCGGGLARSYYDIKNFSIEDGESWRVFVDWDFYKHPVTSVDLRGMQFNVACSKTYGRCVLSFEVNTDYWLRTGDVNVDYMQRRWTVDGMNGKVGLADFIYCLKDDGVNAYRFSFPECYERGIFVDPRTESNAYIRLD